MKNSNIKTSGFSLPKGKHLKGDDYFEISYFDGGVIAVLCDGVGSAEDGAKAAQKSVDFLTYSLKNRPLGWSIEKSIRHFISTINNILYRESIEQYDREEMLTTLVLAVIEGDRLYGANVGDSRLYLLRQGGLTLLSRDHTENQKDMENVLTGAIGLSQSVEPYYFETDLISGDEILLCSDGLYNILDQQSIISGIGVGASFLVKQANSISKDDLPDDTTAITIKISEVDPRIKLKQTKLLLKERYKKGETIDGYRLIKPLVQNHRTWLCQKNGVNYVIKFAPHEIEDDEKMLDLFVKEVWNAKRLKAGFFPKAVVPKNRTHRYYIMQYIDGVTLKERLKSKTLGIDETIELAQFLLNMSQFLLRRDLIHGDIKPENIILTRRKEKRVFKMVDFGSIAELYEIDSRAGTPSYLAPERFDQAPACEQSELYAIAVVLYESLTGKFPFGEIEPFQNPNFDKAIKPPSVYNPKVPLWLDHAILHSLDPDPDRRYKHYSQLLHNIKYPDKVEPYYAKTTTLIEKKPLQLCRIALAVSIIVIILLLTK